MKNLCFLALLGVFILFVTDSSAKSFNWRIHGRIKCSGTEEGSDEYWLPDAKVELMEADSFALDPDDHLGKAESNETGHFEVNGTESEVSNAEPYLIVEHKCKREENDDENCVYRSRITLPSEPEEQNVYIFVGEEEYANIENGDEFDNLEMKTEKIHC